MTEIKWNLCIKTVSEANISENHWIKNKRHKAQKALIHWEFIFRKPVFSFPLLITLTRIASRKLDKEDNLPVAFKWIKDAIADNIFPGKQAGRADDDERLQWKYSQRKGKPKEYAIEILFSHS